jgi:fucose permease
VLLPIVIVGAILPAVVLGGVTDFWFIFALVVIMSLFTAPVAPLADSATLAALGNARERYGSQRVWGAVGWGLSTVTFGWMVQQVGRNGGTVRCWQSACV